MHCVNFQETDLIKHFLDEQLRDLVLYIVASCSNLKTLTVE